MKFGVYARRVVGTHKMGFHRRGEWVESDRAASGRAFRAFAFDTYEDAQQYAEALLTEYSRADIRIKEVRK